MIRTDDSAPAVAVDLTPIIDMVFLLLIFFLVATTYNQIEREMRIALPFASTSGPISGALREIIVNVAADGGVIVQGRSIELDELKKMVTDAVSANPEQKVTVRGDRTTAYGSVVKVLDVCKAAGIQEPFLDTVMEN